MPSWLIALFFAAGVTGFAFTKLVRMTGNASPKQTYGGALLAGVVAYIFFYTLTHILLGFDQ